MVDVFDVCGSVLVLVAAITVPATASRTSPQAAMAMARRRRSAFSAARCWASSRWARRSRSRWLFVFAMTAHATCRG